MISRFKNRALKDAAPVGRKRVFALMTAALALMTAAPSASIAGVGATRHNLGFTSPYQVKSTQTSEICVFCHTPHSSHPSTPLWNKALSGDNYNPYASLTMVAAVGQPTGSSKLCLSCHDGTIALGSMLNLPGPEAKGVPMGGTLTVTGPGVSAGGMIAPTLEGGARNPEYIGSDLRDDHPISFVYTLSQDNVEIKSADALPQDVKLDSGNQLQCTSCHNPHGTNYPKFMTRSVENGSLCSACHHKKYWDMDSTVPIHKTSTALWTGGTSDVNPYHMDMGASGYTDDTPLIQSCLACHRSHGGASGKPLLKGTDPANLNQTVNEEWLCFNCHNAKMQKGGTPLKEMEPLFGPLYVSKHDVKGTAGAHIPRRAAAGDPVTEDQANLGTSRHAECADCHNPHGAKTGNHTIGGVGGFNGNIIGPNIIGSWGVKPNTIGWPPAGTAEDQSNYAIVHFSASAPGVNDQEGYLCLKCHSSYAYGTTPPAVPSGNADGTIAYQSDPTADFNINNESYHPVFTTSSVATGRNQPPVNANPNWVGGLGLTNTFRYMDFPGIGDRTGWYNVMHTGKITCSDCHSSSESNDPQGPHGSKNKWILRNNEAGEAGATAANFCYNCHRRKVYGDEDFIPAPSDANLARVPHPVDGQGAASPFYKSGADTGNNSNKFGILCLTCHGGSSYTGGLGNNHMRGVHGSNDAAGPLAGSDPLGRRMMNGACVESHAHATTTSRVVMNFRIVDPSADKVCKKNFTNFTGTENFAIYDYW
ncbi:MAG: hypothetical protein HZB21_05095 [Deltaproteobacteria bacterium]|nr:hypothetical protein [Deltaproteobacteria bacterium]